MSGSMRCSVFVHALRLFFGAGFSLLCTLMNNNSFMFPSDAKSIYPSYKNKKLLATRSEQLDNDVNINCTLQRKLCRYWFVSARVTKGNSTLVGVDITILISGADGRNTSQRLLFPQPSGLVLLDGIYGTYVTTLSLKGLYDVTVFVKYDGHFLELHPSNASLIAGQGYFERSVSCGKLLQTTDYNQGEDIFPPAAVDKVTVSSVDPEASTVTLSWVAPGDDFYEGSVDVYRMTTIGEAQNSTVGLTFDLPLTPKPAGEIEQYTLTVPHLSTFRSVNFSLSACDESGKCSQSPELSVAVCDYSRNVSMDLLNRSESFSSPIGNTALYVTMFANVSNDHHFSKLERCSSGKHQRPVWIVHRTEAEPHHSSNCKTLPDGSGVTTSNRLKNYFLRLLRPEKAEKLKITHRLNFTKLGIARAIKLAEAPHKYRLEQRRSTGLETNAENTNGTLKVTDKSTYRYRLPFIPRIRLSKRFDIAADENEVNGVETTLKEDNETATSFTEEFIDDITAPADDAEETLHNPVSPKPRSRTTVPPNTQHKHRIDDKPTSIMIAEPPSIDKTGSRPKVGMSTPRPIDAEPISAPPAFRHITKSTSLTTTTQTTTTRRPTTTTTRRPTTTTTRRPTTTTTRRPTTTTTKRTTTTARPTPRRNIPDWWYQSPRRFTQPIPKPNLWPDTNWRARSTNQVSPKPQKSQTSKPKTPKPKTLPKSKKGHPKKPTRPIRKLSPPHSKSSKKKPKTMDEPEETTVDYTDSVTDDALEAETEGYDYLETTTELRYDETELTTILELDTFAFDKDITETSTSPTTDRLDLEGRDDGDLDDVLGGSTTERLNFTIYVKPRIWRSPRTWWWLLATCFFLAGALKLVAFALIIVCLNFWLLKRGYVYEKKDRPRKPKSTKRKKKKDKDKDKAK